MTVREKIEKGSGCFSLAASWRKKEELRDCAEEREEKLWDFENFNGQKSEEAKTSSIVCGLFAKLRPIPQINRGLLDVDLGPNKISPS